jgi:hypothetical protein
MPASTPAQNKASVKKCMQNSRRQQASGLENTGTGVMHKESLLLAVYMIGLAVGRAGYTTSI